MTQEEIDAIFDKRMAHALALLTDEIITLEEYDDLSERIYKIAEKATNALEGIE